MASSVVDGALSAAKSAAAKEVALQLGLEGDLEVIKYDLELFQTNLVASDEGRGHDPVSRVWARQVRDVAYDVEDYIEDFAIHLGGSSWWWCSPSRILNRRRIAVEMKKLRARVGYAWERRPLIMEQAAPPLPARAEVNPGGPGGLAAPPSADLGNTSLRLMQGLKRSSGASSLSNLLARPDRSLILVSVASARTSTPIGRAYDELTMTGQFQSRAWVTVPHPFNLTEFIRSLLRQFHANSVQVEEEFVLATVDVQESIETMGAPQLVRSLAENLHDKTYLLVIDGISTREEWDSIRLYFRPDVNKGSRIIVTSGIADVAKYCAGGHTSTLIFLFAEGGLLSAFCNVVNFNTAFYQQFPYYTWLTVSSSKFE
ncbi:hypothetical protein HU200_000062 [Digitaria exilis]|uniref:Rx N-terminal domain-containing protein n=1 Tax=Digitaria exilis TaxID=1010633 RepID=A0A835G3A2_9POAL|nr:hypothetical protein HU200_000062 [Digitaria exilis]